MKPLLPIATAAAVVVVADQAAKAWLRDALPLGTGIKVWSFFNLVHITNSGVAFGMGASGGRSWLLLGLTLLGLIVLAVWAVKATPRSFWARLGLGLALGGAVGNLVDRIWLRGVTDFLDFHWGGLHWPAFNLADAALTVGFCLLILSWLRRQG